MGKIILVKGSVIVGEYDEQMWYKLTMTSIARKKHGEGSGVSQRNTLLLVTVTLG